MNQLSKPPRLVRVGLSRMAFTLAGLRTMTFLLMMCPSSMSLDSPKAHLSRLWLSRLVRHFSRRMARCPKWLPNTMKSLRMNYIKDGMYGLKISTIMHWKVVGAVLRSNITTAALKGDSFLIFDHHLDLVVAPAAVNKSTYLKASNYVKEIINEGQQTRVTNSYSVKLLVVDANMDLPSFKMTTIKYSHMATFTHQMKRTKVIDQFLPL